MTPHVAVLANPLCAAAYRTTKQNAKSFPHAALRACQRLKSSSDLGANVPEFRIKSRVERAFEIAYA